jgi:hypothetical protein
MKPIVSTALRRRRRFTAIVSTRRATITESIISLIREVRRALRVRRTKSSPLAKALEIPLLKRARKSTWTNGRLLTRETFSSRLERFRASVLRPRTRRNVLSV